MTARRGALAALAAGSAVALVLPAAASAHAALLRTVPSASVVVNSSPGRLALTYSEPIEPRFAIVSVTDAGGHQVSDGRPARAAGDPRQLVTPLRFLGEGWYLVFWRVISADGHPVRGAFTFAVGPNPGPAPQFVIPSVSETAAKPSLLFARWIVFLSVMSALGLFLLRIAIARPLVSRLPGSSLRAVTVAFAVAIGLALVATPVYVDLATAQFALRSAFDLGAVVPLARDSSFGRGYLDLELLLALFALAAGIAIAVDRPSRRVRSAAELLAIIGAVAAAAAVLLVPGLAGHASQTSPRGFSLALDWVHLLAGSIWVGGLLGLLVLWRSAAAVVRVAALSVVVPRFSRIALASVIVLVGSGIGASLVHLPTLGSLWQTNYGKALVLKIALLVLAVALASVNLLRTRPRLAAAAVAPEAASRASGLLRRLVGAEVGLVLAAVFAAGVLSSLAPPSKALAQVGKAIAKVGPGPVTRVVEKGPYRLDFHVQPNRAALPNSFAVGITKDGKPLRGADVTARFAMLDMEMGQLAYHLPERRAGYFERTAPALVMVGHWALTFEVRPRRGSPFDVLIVDRASG